VSMRPEGEFGSCWKAPPSVKAVPVREAAGACAGVVAAPVFVARCAALSVSFCFARIRAFKKNAYSCYVYEYGENADFYELLYFTISSTSRFWFRSVLTAAEVRRGSAARPPLVGIR
jgi:hypothetical protein